MIIPDINLLIYAYDSESQFHAKARAWWEKCLSGAEPVGLPHVVVFGFLRIITNARVFQRPLLPSEAGTCLRSWLYRPNVQTLEAAPDHVERVLKLLENIGAAGNLVSDAQIAAFALENEAVLHTSDTDFIRFQNLRCYNPVTQIASGGRPKVKKL